MSDRRRQLAYLFDEGGENTLTAELRGGKGLGLSELAKLGMPIPPGFTVTTTAARAYAEHGRLPDRLAWHLNRCLTELERRTGKGFGNAENPLLVSVRSGAAVSMPGMMDTVLNVGLNAQAMRGLTRKAGQKFADDCRERLIAQYRATVLGVAADADVPVPESPLAQLAGAVEAVLASWNSERARAYRDAHGIPHWWGTAINVQAMVFGNHGRDSGTGVVFSRDVRTGARGLYGEFLPEAQGEDVVAGVRTPIKIADMRGWNPRVYAELETMVSRLEQHYGDVVDVEFTVEEGRLYLLQCRKAKRSARAATTFAVHQVWDGAWDRREAVARVPAAQAAELARPCFEPQVFASATRERAFAKGLPASPGAVVGRAVFSPTKAKEMAGKGERVVLVRHDTSPDDLPGMLASVAIVTAVGGETSHAAVVARGLGRAAVVGCNGLSVGGREASCGNKKIKEGDLVSVSGDTGMVVLGEVPFAEVSQYGEVANFLRWLDRYASPVSKRSEPRIGFEFAEKQFSANTLLNNFYLTDAMARAAAGTPLAREAETLRSRVHTETAEIFACYLLIAVAGETRHASGQSNGSGKATERLQKEFEFTFGGERYDRQMWAHKNLAGRPLSAQVEFFHLCADVFDLRDWSSSYGGSRWGTIARAPLGFLSGELGHSVFVDHAFDLQHNGGRMFDKHPMLTDLTNEGRLRRQLDAKKAAKSPAELREVLDKLHNKFDSDVVALFEKGRGRYW